MDSEGQFFFVGPDFDFDFSVSDAQSPNLYSYRILVFKIEDNAGHVATTAALKTGLQKLVERCPPLGGTIRPLEAKPGEQKGWKKVFPGPGIKLVVRDLRDKLDFEDLNARGFPIEEFKCEDVVPYTLALVTKGETPGSVFQYSWIKGGALLTVGIAHPIADGNAMNTLLGILAQECRDATLEPGQTEDTKLPQIKPVIGIDRSPARTLKGTSKNKPEDHPSYTIHPELLPAKRDFGPPVDQSIFMFQIAPSKLIELKRAASTTNPRISTHDAIAALAWRSVMFARYKSGTVVDLDAEVECCFPTDVRRLVGLDKDYIGNMIYQITCPCPLRELLDPSSLPKVASIIRAVLEAQTKEHVTGREDLLKSLPHLGQMQVAFVKNINTTAFATGSSWRAEQIYGADWGSAFGPVIRFRSPDAGFYAVVKGMSMICPRVQGTGPAEFQTWLEPEGWKALQKDEMFTRYFSRIGGDS